MKAGTALLIVLAAVVLPSCSFRLSHPDGSVTYVGLVNLKEGSAGDLPLVHSRRYGVMLDAGASGNGLALGYDDRLVVKPSPDAVTEIDYTTDDYPEVSQDIHQ